jgi:hypothetical protein
MSLSAMCAYAETMSDRALDGQLLVLTDQSPAEPSFKSSPIDP